MPQLTRFPYVPQGDPDRAVDALIALCREVPVEGEPFPAFRERLRAHGMWDRERVDDTLGFFRMSRGDLVVPSPVMRSIGGAANEAAACEALAERLWAVNPLLFKAIVERLAERIHPRDEIIAAIDSYAYAGAPLTRPQVESWIKLALGLKLLRVIGIALTLDERGQRYVQRAKDLDAAEYLAEDEPEVLPEPVRSSAAEAEPEPAADLAAAPEPSASVPRGPLPAGASVPVRIPGLIPAADLSDPLGRDRPVPAARFAGRARFDADVLEETSARVARWWTAQPPTAPPPGAAHFGADSERWMDASQETLYRLAVAAALSFRLDREPGEVERAFAELDRAGVLEALYYGTAPDALPDDVDPKALMLASLVARRCAEAPELAASLERAGTAAAAFAALDEALGRGLFRLELFWIMRQLETIGALRFPDLADYTALPHRLVRDQLFRLGYLESPYAFDTAALMAAAAAARRAAGAAASPDAVIAAFATTAGCGYDCPRRRACDYACKERLE